MCKCSTKYCRNEAKRGGRCWPCNRRMRIEANPYRYWYQVVKDNAKRRKKPFTLTFGYWVKWCDEYGYLAMKGRSRFDATIDCIVNELGYADGNIQPLAKVDNCTKGVKDITWNYITHRWEMIERLPPTAAAGDDLPF